MRSETSSASSVKWADGLPAVVVLAVLYGLASLFLDPGGTLGTDTGAKVATLDHMVATGTWHPEVPYWAEDLDPDGSLHPIYDSEQVDGRWVHVTTLPMLLAARPLYDLGGYRLALALPMAGAVGAAVAARALARRVGGADAGRRAFWLVGLASPVAVYALDLWEHTLGVAAVTAAVAVLAGIVDHDGPVERWRAPVAGALLGAAATMRTESFVYAVVGVGAVGVVLLLRRQVGPALLAGASAVAGFAVPWLANRALEEALGGTNRSERASGAASNALSEVGERAEEALLTLLGARPGAVGSVVVTGALVVGCVVLAVVLQRRGQVTAARAALAGAGAIHLLVLVDRGLGFVPGLLVAAPLAAVALAAPPAGRAGRYVLAVAGLALPLVWAFQYLGGAGPQWGGRYTLPSSVLLVTLGAVAVGGLVRWLATGLVVLAGAVTLCGVAWLGERSRAVDRWFEAATARPEDVLIARNGFLVREAGAASDDRRWLTAVRDRDLAEAVDVVRRAGLGSFGVVDESREPGLDGVPGVTHVATERTELLGAHLYVHAYEVAP